MRARAFASAMPITTVLLLFGFIGVIAAEAGTIDYSHPIYVTAENSLIAAALSALMMLWATHGRSPNPPLAQADLPLSRAGWRTITLFAIVWGITIALRAIAPSNLVLVLLFMPIALLVLPGAALLLALFPTPHLHTLLALSVPLSLAIMMIASAWAIRLGIGLTPFFFVGAGASATLACLLLIAHRARRAS